MRRWTLLALPPLLSVWLWAPSATAQQSAPARSATAPITFDQYRDFRLQIIARREEALQLRLADPNLAASDKAKLQRQKTYYDRWAQLPAAERDRLFRERFDEIDSDHDGSLDAEERASWRQQQHDYYRQLAAERARVAAPSAPVQH